jgi:glycosyltransferase involved in cell wall biosynthesis
LSGTAALLTTSFPRSPGDPSGHFVLSDALRTARAGERVVVLCPGPPREPPPGLTIVPLGGGAAFGWPGVAARLREDPRRVVDVARVMGAMASHLRATTAHRTIAHFLLPCGLLALLDGRPTTLWGHGSDVRLVTAIPGLASTFARLVAARRARLVFVAAHLRDSFLRAAGDAGRAIAAQVVVEAAPIDVEPLDEAQPARLAELRARLPRVPYAIWVGRMVAEKGPADAVLAASRAGVPLVLIGSGPAALPPATGVLRLGSVPRPETLAAIRDARALVFTSRHEGVPTVVREALALGVPVLALESAAVRELHAGPRDAGPPRGDLRSFRTLEELASQLASLFEEAAPILAR